MKSLLVLAVLLFSATSQAEEILIEGDTAQKLYDSYQAQEQMIGDDLIVKAGNGIVCWQHLVPHTTDVAKVRCLDARNN